MRKRFFLGLVLLAISFFAGCNTEKNPNYEFVVQTQDSYSINKCTGIETDSSLEIPEEYNNSKVTIILSNAFEHTNMKTLTMRSIVEIDQEAFAQCRHLENVDFGCVKFIGTLAFYNCVKLETIRLPDTLETIEDGAFDQCTNLKDVYFEGNPETMGREIFHKGVTIHGKPGGSVEAYAQENGYHFVPIE